MKVFLLILMIQTTPGAERIHYAHVYMTAERCLSEKVQLDANMIAMGAHKSFTSCVKEFVRTKPEDFIQPRTREQVFNYLENLKR